MSVVTIKWGIIVEGQAEVEAVPILMRRFEWECFNGTARFEIPSPVRAKRNKLVKKKNDCLAYDDDGIRNAVELAAKNIHQSGVILLLLDANKDPGCVIGPAVLQRNIASHGHLRHSVVFAVKEFEAWYLASIVSLAGYNGIPDDVAPWTDPESSLGAKGALARIMNRPYSPTVDQPKFASRFNIHAARSAPSFDKLYRDIYAVAALIWLN